MPIVMRLDAEAKYVELRVFDRVKWEDWHRISPELEAFIMATGPVRMLEVIEHFEGLDPDLLWDGLRMDRQIIPHISHCAIVGDLKWLAPLDRAKEALRPLKLRLFSLEMESFARTWLDRAGDARTHVVSHRPAGMGPAGMATGRSAVAQPPAGIRDEAGTLLR